MNPDKIKLLDLLEADEGAGTVLFNKRRVLVFDADAMGLLRKELIDSLGMDGARGVLARFGYAKVALSPEPYVYEEAFAMRWLIQDQIAGKPELNYDAAKGEVKSPLLLWGPYLWADGETPRKAGTSTFPMR